MTLAACDGCRGCPAPGGGPKVGAEAADASVQIGQVTRRARQVANLERVKGDVTVERKGERIPATPGPLLLQDKLRTGPDGEASVRFPGGRTVDVGPEASFVVSEDAAGLVLEVERGVIISRIPAKSAEPEVSLSILTPFGLTRVSRGEHEVTIDVGKDATRVSVALGGVEFVSRNGQAITAKEGESVEATGGDVQLRGREIKAEPIAITLAPAGAAEVKKKDQPKWKAVKKDDPLEEGDALRVKDGRTTIGLTGSMTRYLAEKGAELTLEGSSRSDGVEESRFDLKKGAMQLALAARKKSKLMISGLVMESENGGQFNVARDGEGFSVSAQAGDVKLTHEGAEQVVRAGQAALVGQGKIQVATEDGPDVALPSRNSLRVFHPGVPKVALGWDGEPGDYWVEVAGDAGFNQTILSGMVHAPTVAVPAPRRGALYWRVFAADGTTEVAKGSASFAQEVATGTLARLRNDVPDGAPKTTIFYQDKPPAVTFTYKEEAKAAKYKVAVFREDALDKAVAERTVPAVSAPLEAGILSEGSYVWSVTPLSATGEELRGGKMNKLELVYDNSVPTLVVTSPKNGDALKAGEVPVAGVAPVGARLAINGKQVPLDAKNRFDASTVPIGRPPVVIFRLSRPPAADSYTVRVLRRGK